MFQRIRAPSAMAGKPDGARYLADPDALEQLAERCRGGEEDLRASDEFSLVLHDIRMAGAWKRTNRGRLREAEEMLATHIAPALRDDPLLLDLGASDGITTLDAVRFLTERFGKPVRAVLTDLNLWLLRFRRGPVVEYRASNGEPIMMRLGAFGLRLAEQRKHLESGRDPLASLYLRCAGFRAAMRLETRLSLVNPLVHANRGIEIRELDVLKRDAALIGRFAAVRASNVLNSGYFAPPQIAEAAAHIHAYLREGGCLVVSRNRDVAGGEIEDGSVWLRAADRFSRVADFGNGSEVAAVIDAWRAP